MGLSFPVASPGDPVKVFVSARNVDADSITTGYATAWVLGASSFNGGNVYKADQNVTDKDTSFMGFASQDVAGNAIGRFQVQGFVDSIFLSNVGSSLTINTGDPIIPGDAPGGMFSAAPTYANSGFKYALVSNPPAAISAAGYCSGMLRGPLL